MHEQSSDFAVEVRGHILCLNLDWKTKGNIVEVGDLNLQVAIAEQMALNGMSS